MRCGMYHRGGRTEPLAGAHVLRARREAPAAAAWGRRHAAPPESPAQPGLAPGTVRDGQSRARCPCGCEMTPLRAGGGGRRSLRGSGAPSRGNGLQLQRGKSRRGGRKTSLASLRLWRCSRRRGTKPGRGLLGADGGEMGPPAVSVAPCEVPGAGVTGGERGPGRPGGGTSGNPGAAARASLGLRLSKQGVPACSAHPPAARHAPRRPLLSRRRAGGKVGPGPGGRRRRQQQL